YKNKELGDPMVSENHIVSLGWADPFELEEMVTLAYRINDYLNGLFAGLNIRLVDFKIEFGRLFGEFDELYILLADEITPDNCRLWDARTNEKLDKDRFREDMGGLIDAYQDIAKRLGLIPESGIIQGGNIDEQIASGLSEIDNELGREKKLRSVNKAPPTKPWKS
ncbi:MAG: phosphoribosylaminoimidazolesuccinocarboxamide synthase, partial [Micavibrio aeruginosavorus]